jgi:hypothetical protein
VWSYAQIAADLRALPSLARCAAESMLRAGEAAPIRALERVYIDATVAQLASQLEGVCGTCWAASEGVIGDPPQLELARRVAKGQTS